MVKNKINLNFLIIMGMFVDFMHAEHQPTQTVEKQAAPSLLIKQEQKNESAQMPNSKNGLKESIGDEVKEVLHACAGINTALGKLQIEFAALQKQLFDNVTRLIDNSKPYKKATRDALQKTLATLQGTYTSLNEHLRGVTKLKEQVSSDALLGVK